MLPVFLAEERCGGTGEIKEAEHGLADTGEVAGAVGIFKSRRGCLGRERGHGWRCAGGVDVSNGRHEHGRRAGGAAVLKVGLKRVGVAFKVGGVVELGWVDEDGRHGSKHAALGRERCGLADEGRVTRVERAHGGYEDDAGCGPMGRCGGGRRVDRQRAELLGEVGGELGIAVKNAHG